MGVCVVVGEEKVDNPLQEESQAKPVVMIGEKCIHWPVCITSLEIILPYGHHEERDV